MKKLNDFIDSLSDHQLDLIVGWVIDDELSDYPAPVLEELINMEDLIQKMYQDPNTVEILRSEIKSLIGLALRDRLLNREYRRDYMPDMYDIPMLADFLQRLDNKTELFWKNQDSLIQIESALDLLKRHGYHITAPT